MLTADAAQPMHRCIRQMRHCQQGEVTPACSAWEDWLKGVILAQVPEELQGNLFTAAVAGGLRVVPHIKPGSDRMRHR